MAPVRIGIIGSGAVAQVQHLPNLSALKDLYSVEIVCDLSPSQARIVAEEYHVPHHTGDWRQLLAYDLDAVRALYDDHCQTDLLPEARALDDADRLGLVIAGKADVVPRDLGLNRTYVLAESGHNVHVDALPELLDVVVGTHGADWV